MGYFAACTAGSMECISCVDGTQNKRVENYMKLKVPCCVECSHDFHFLLKNGTDDGRNIFSIFFPFPEIILTRQLVT